MSNPRGKQVASDIRGAWVRACRILESEGKPLSEYLVDAIKKDPLAAVNAISKFTPKELEVERKRRASSLSDAELEAIAQRGREPAFAEADSQDKLH